MSNKQATTLGQKKDRRGLLALIGAGGAAAVAALLSRNGSAEAGHDATNIFHLGQDNTDTPGSTTKRSADLAGIALHVDNASTSSAARGVEGQVAGGGLGVRGFSPTGFGVFGVSSTGTGVRGEGSDLGAGVVGFNPTVLGVRGDSSSGDGVLGHRFDTTGVGAGVQGFSGVSESAAPDRVGGRFVGLDTGVRGAGKTGVIGKGTAAGGIGVRGNSGSGKVGVRGRAKGSGKVGVKATAANGATALEVVGGPMRLPVLTTAERNALTPKKGMLIYNSTVNKIQARIVGSWVNL